MLIFLGDFPGIGTTILEIVLSVLFELIEPDKKLCNNWKIHVKCTVQSTEQ